MHILTISTYCSPEEDYAKYSFDGKLGFFFKEISPLINHSGKVYTKVQYTVSYQQDEDWHMAECSINGDAHKIVERSDIWCGVIHYPMSSECSSAFI